MQQPNYELELISLTSLYRSSAKRKEPVTKTQYATYHLYPYTTHATYPHMHPHVRVPDVLLNMRTRLWLVRRWGT